MERTMATKWVQELVEDLRKQGYQVPVINGFYELWWKGETVRLPNGQPVRMHQTPSPSPIERKNMISKLVQAGVLKEDPRASVVRAGLSREEREELRQARKKVSLAKATARKEARQAMTASNQAREQYEMRVLYTRVVQAEQKLGVKRHLAALVFDNDPEIWSSIGNVEVTLGAWGQRPHYVFVKNVARKKASIEAAVNSVLSANEATIAAMREERKQINAQIMEQAHKRSAATLRKKAAAARRKKELQKETKAEEVEKVVVEKVVTKLEETEPVELVAVYTLLDVSKKLNGNSRKELLKAASTLLLEHAEKS
jgi:hypothetical protein